MRAVVLGYHNIGCVGLEALRHHGFEVAAVFTHTDSPGETIWFDSVAQAAAAHGIPVFAPDDINHPLWVERIRALKPDIIFSFYYRKLIKQPILDIPPAGCINLHGSLLPAYRGRCPVNWVLVNGECETGVTLHYMTPRPDDGDILGQLPVTIDDDDTALSLSAKAATEAGKLLDTLLPRILDGTAARTPQDHAKATYFGGRRPADGEIQWDATARRVRNLVRAVTRPYPGAFTHVGNRKCLVWAVSDVARPSAPGNAKVAPGTVLSTAPLVVACGGESAVRIDFGEADGGIYQAGPQLAQTLGLVAGMTFGPSAENRIARTRRRSVLILGVNGFIGNALGERLLRDERYDVHGMDLHSNYIQPLLGKPRFHFDQGDIGIHREWIEYHVRSCDIVIPLVAIATPIEYVRNPLRVFELDFEENLRVVRYCVKYGKRVIFPSTSEVYGMCEEEEFDEDNSRLVLGPIRMQRWIYSCIKQLLDRVIWAYGQKEGLRFTLFRPFNWIGPKLDSLESARIGSSRAITQLILNLVEGTPIQLIDGGRQKRCFLDSTEAIECLFRIIENEDEICDGKIVNIGNPNNEASIRELAEMLVDEFERHPLRSRFPPYAGMVEVESGAYYGAGYEDVQYRRPSIRNAQRLLKWSPSIPLRTSVSRTLDFFLKEAVRSGHFDRPCE